ncbi:MAG: aminotransferase class III-fold pyridoxal phosphate-dependent enzyme [Candidatus Aminicenantes bacterium]|nr:aminotransferase class III-fold pyridoxal phosphate-dependent enzyme [Candidatus Aminicenantes bacterium]NIM79486.1 aminotransferase class III-fold pyridoxal phosphate-dependent enzyme [Candidatus Aminicenantes bacterium]NIN18772.1 aminotransferase class III-fold pyridoxal phosphate-dependent enzyme [Candidatus Aminicenantes bacterium]NIN42694.1 aminotransferase class III-fold pyridoxal phosphate-dependent enzyme [Candidatus Aminicenantes bacterium]NIN85428.1 aminotransferase class III-fold 
MKQPCHEGIFKPASHITIQLIKDFNENRKHTFLLSTGFISPEAGQVGYLLNECFNQGRPDEERVRYMTFFGNSRFEALHGAIKIARARLTGSMQQNSKEVLIYDPKQELQLTIDPLERGKEKALIPEVQCFREIEELLNHFHEIGFAPAGLILRVDKNLSLETVEELLQICREKGVLTIIEESDTDFKDGSALVNRVSVLPDVVITGESLTQYEIPFGAFSMRDTIYLPMNNSQTCMIHTSAFGGNRVVLTRVRDYLLANVPAFKNNNSIISYCREIEEHDRERINAYASFINPGLKRFYARSGLDIHPVNAHGSILTVKEGEKERKIIDCASAGAITVRGHTPGDIVPEVLDLHNPEENYWEKLCQTLREKTGFSHAFPAVSGASAVEIAMTLAMLANKDRTRIIVFNGNFAGTTLLSLVGSQEESLRQPFFPLYFDVLYIDPMSRMSKEVLKMELESQKIALVWLEVFQGQTIRHIPREFLDLIREYKEKGGYIVAVDEILTGIYRMGEFLAHKETNLSPDIITLSKALTDATFPCSVALVSSDVYQGALSYKPEVVNYLEKLYLNQLGSHIALHVLEKLSSAHIDITNHVKHISQILRSGLTKIAEKSPFIRKIDGEGLIFSFHFNYDMRILKFFGANANAVGRILFPLFMFRLCQEKANVFLILNRCMPALTITEEEVHLLIENLTRLFCGFSGKFFIRTRFPRYILRKLRKKRKRINRPEKTEK